MPDPLGGGAVPGLDGFKEVNDSLGHAAGDRLLIQVTQRLAASVRPSDTVARFGGDEFAVLIEDASDDLELAAVAERTLEELCQPFSINDRELHISGSMGIARMDPDVDRVDQLLRNADLAMYRAKAAGQGRVGTLRPRHAHRTDSTRPARGRPAPSTGRR